MKEFIINALYHIVIIAIGIVIGLQANGWLIHWTVGN